MGQPKDIQLLGIEMDTLWGCDAYGRVEPHPLAAVAIAKDGAAIRPNASPDLIQYVSVASPFACKATSWCPDKPPSILEKARDIVAATRPVNLIGGPSYIFESVEDATALHLIPPKLEVFISSAEIPPTLLAARPENWWKPEEWADLLAGHLGPWAIGTVAERVVSLCHTPVARSKAAEAGVWTHPDERGRGFASIVTAAWAKVAAATFDTLFYSTAATNIASQSVARKLKLRQIGWIWQLRDDH